MKKVIFTQRVELVEAYGERRDCADQQIVNFFSECGYLPMPVPNNVVLAENYIDEINPAGIILTGGNSLVKYGGDAPERDALEQRLIELAILNHIPLYGFCRGMQSILDYFNCDLIEVEGHIAVRHVVKYEDGEVMVNSYHSQACMKLNECSDLIATAQAADGVIEAIRHAHYSILATMWHPERESEFSQKDISMVRHLFR